MRTQWKIFSSLMFEPFLRVGLDTWSIVFAQLFLV